MVSVRVVEPKLARRSVMTLAGLFGLLKITSPPMAGRSSASLADMMLASGSLT